MLRIAKMKKETTMTPTQAPRIIAENQMPPKKQKGKSLRQTAGEPSCKKVLFDSEEDSDIKRQQVWDSMSSREQLIGIMSAWKNMPQKQREAETKRGDARRARELESDSMDGVGPETYRAFMLLSSSLALRASPRDRKSTRLNSSH